MGIEAIGSIGTAVGSVASGIGKAGVGAVPAGASLESMFGPKMGAVNLPMNEGPAGFGGLTETMPLQIGQINPIEKISFNASAEVETISSVESFLAQARMPQIEPMNISEIVPTVAPKLPFREFVMPQTEPMVAPWVMPTTEPAVEAWPKLQPETKTENRVSPAVAPAVLPQPLPEEQTVEEIVEEKVEKQEPEEKLEEEEIVERQMYLEDENVSAQRKAEVREAVVKARTEADRLGLKKIAGWLVAKFLPAEHEGIRSQVVKKTGPDGSYQETVEAIAGAGELEFEDKAVERFDGIVAEKKPVKLGKSGNPVGNKDVARVFMYWLIKPIQASEEVIKRVVKKKVFVAQQGTAPTVISEKKVIKTEASLDELNPALAEVFPQAA